MPCKKLLVRIQVTASIGCIWLAVTCPALAQDLADKRDPISFNRDIRPILSDKCFQCHGPDEESREADLRFDLRETAMSMIEPGDPESSELIVRITAKDEPGYQMPPAEAHKPLTDDEIKRLTQWVKEGANWDQFWAYREPVRTPIPTIENDDWSVNWIDKLVLARLKENGLQPAPPADRVTLLRRLYFDLVGLPPTPDQVQAFLDDNSDDAYQQQVDALLNSQHFGERLAMYWLDLVRYADTVGYHGDQDQNISPYRDWVIDAFNDNMPFDQFTRDQLAGDLVESPTLQQKIASGYNRLLQTTHEGGLQPKEYRSIYAADRVRNVSAVWMGATVGCAQCHDHKYDPYTTRDFYALSAFFADIDDEQHFKNGTNALPTRRSPELLVISEQDRALLDEAQQIAGQQQSLVNKLKQQVKQAEQTAKQDQQAKPATGDPAEGQTSEEITSLEDLREELKSAEARLRQLNQQAKEIENRGAWTMISQPLETPREVRILPRGDWLDESGPIVQPAIPAFMGQLDQASRATRLDLANWLTDSSQVNGKLTARVFANRFWYLFMGVGNSRSLDDFGGQGEAPAYPELLDNLALEFAQDWDVKRLIRTIVTSRTYRQSSLVGDELRQHDPYNQLFARQTRYRLPAEVVRDTALAISGLLNVDKIGGRSIKPYQPAGYYRHLNFPPRRYHHSSDASQWRRGVYVHWQRMFLHPTYKALDAPTREECTAQRSQSNTPLAALALLNDPSFVEAARVFAARIIENAATDSVDDRLDYAFAWAVNRSPNETEREVLTKLLAAMQQDYADNPESAGRLISTGQAPTSAELDPVELASWTSVARAILNLNETITRN